MKWGGVSIDTSRIKNSDGSTIETRFQTVESAGGGGGGINGIHAMFHFPGTTITNLVGNPTTNVTATISAYDAYLSPFRPAESFSISQLGTEVTTATASGRIRIVIYSSGTNFDFSTNRRVNLELATEFMLNNTTGIKTYNLAENFTFTTDKIYWMGVVCTLGATVRAVSPTTNAFGHGISSTSNVYNITAYGNCDANNPPSSLNLVAPGSFQVQVIRMLVV